MTALLGTITDVNNQIARLTRLREREIKRLVRQGGREVDLCDIGYSRKQAKTAIRQATQAIGLSGGFAPVTVTPVGPDSDHRRPYGDVTMVPAKGAIRTAFTEHGLYWHRHSTAAPVHFNSHWLGITDRGTVVQIRKITDRVLLNRPHHRNELADALADWPRPRPDTDEVIDDLLDAAPDEPLDLFLLAPPIDLAVKAQDQPFRVVLPISARLVQQPTPLPMPVQSPVLSPDATQSDDIGATVLTGHGGCGKTVAIQDHVLTVAGQGRPVVAVTGHRCEGERLRTVLEEDGIDVRFVDPARPSSLPRGSLDLLRIDTTATSTVAELVASLGLSRQPFHGHEVNHALQAGVSQGQKRSTGSALQWAIDSGVASEVDGLPDMLKGLLRAAAGSPEVGALIGFDDDPLVDQATVTLFSLDAPVGVGLRTLSERVTAAVYSAAVEVGGRALSDADGGLLAVDDADVLHPSRLAEGFEGVETLASVVDLVWDQPEWAEAARRLRILIGPMDGDHAGAAITCAAAGIPTDSVPWRITKSRWEQEPLSASEPDQGAALPNLSSLSHVDNNGHPVRGSLWLHGPDAERDVIEVAVPEDRFRRLTANPRLSRLSVHHVEHE